MGFKPFVPAMGSVGIPHHSSEIYPVNFSDAMQRGRNNIALSAMRMDAISQALSRVGLNQLAQEIANEVDDLMWTKTMLGYVYNRQLEAEKKNGELRNEDYQPGVKTST